MSKDRLEVIQANAEHKTLRNYKNEIRHQRTEIKTEDYDWLIERVQELEDILDQDHRQAVIESMYEENKRYREALENIMYASATIYSYEMISAINNTALKHWRVNQMNKERLENIEDLFENISNDMMPPYVGIDLNTVVDVKWVIEYAKGQVERVQRLEKAHELKDLEHQGLVAQLKEKDKQNKRYRESIKKLKQMVNDSEIDCGMICNEIREMELGE